MKTESVEFETSSYLQVGTHLTLPTYMYPSTCLTSPHLIKRSMEVSFLGILFHCNYQSGMYPFNTAAMDIGASLLVYLVGGLSCFSFFLSFSPLFCGLELAQIYLDKQYRGRLPAES